MKRAILAALCALLPLSTFAADTAYTALRLVGKQGGDESLGRVLEVRGRFGSPEPQVWKVVLADSGSRGGVREFEVQHGKITSERAPSGRGGAGGPLDLNKLNIDSEGAFTIVNQEAQKVGQPFDRVDYALNSGSRGGTPTWKLELYDGRNGRVGTMEIAADTGNVLRRDIAGTVSGGRPVAQDDRTYLREHPTAGSERRTYVEDRDDPADDRRYVEDDRGRRDYRYREERRVYVESDDEGPGITDIAGKIGRHFQKRGSQLKSFFGR